MVNLRHQIVSLPLMTRSLILGHVRLSPVFRHRLSRRIGEINGASLSSLLDREFIVGTAKCKMLDRQGFVSQQHMSARGRGDARSLGDASSAGAYSRSHSTSLFSFSVLWECVQKTGRANAFFDAISPGKPVAMWDACPWREGTP